jgi:hypothetical protein
MGLKEEKQFKVVFFALTTNIPTFHHSIWMAEIWRY